MKSGVEFYSCDAMLMFKQSGVRNACLYSKNVWPGGAEKTLVALVTF
jgi:hypothetical protein